MQAAGAVTTVDFAAGELRVRGWPAAAPRPPFGLLRAGDGLRGAPRLRRAVLATLRAVGVACDDRLALPPLEVAAPPPLAGVAASMFAGWRRAGACGIVCGLPALQRPALVHAALAVVRRPALVVVPDTAVAALWRQALGARGVPVADHPRDAAIRLATAAAAVRDIAWLGRRHELLVFDLPELVPQALVPAIADGSAATARLGLANDPDARRLLEWSAGLGPVLGVVDAAATPRCVELRVGMPADARQVYDTAWHAFLGAFDRFAAVQPHAGFHSFVQQARGDPQARPGLLAWHRALRIAAWNDAKAAVVARLLRRHRGARVLVFTPDRDSAYQLARRHLVAPITAEFGRAERQAALAAFAAGTLRVLVGPRLLDAGVPERCADVGILVGGGHGRAQRQARCRRVAANGVVYELVALDTVEVGRAQRWRGAAAGATTVVHGG
jgi:hypothetical protein